MQPHANRVSVLAAGAVLVAAMRKVVNHNLADPKHPCHGALVVVEYGAPGSYVELLERLERDRVLAVERDFSTGTIYGSPANNHVFRAFHDMDHLKHELQFCTADEIAVALHGWNSISPLLPKHDKEFLREVYLADTVGQSIYHAANGKFVSDQLAFVVNYVKTGGIHGAG